MSEHRTSLEVRIPHIEVPATQDLFSRVLRMPVENFEPLKIIRYQKGEYFKAHHDANNQPQKGGKCYMRGSVLQSCGDDVRVLEHARKWGRNRVYEIRPQNQTLLPQNQTIFDSWGQPSLHFGSHFDGIFLETSVTWRDSLPGVFKHVKLQRFRERCHQSGNQSEGKVDPRSQKW